MTSPKAPKPAHVEWDPKTKKFLIARRMPGKELLGYDTLQEALAAANSIEQGGWTR